MRPVTRTFSDLHATLYRVDRRAAQNPNYPTMLLTVTGRKSGKPRTVPLIYLQDGRPEVIAAAYAGSDANPTWWLNLKAHPEAVARLRDRDVPVRAELAPPDQRPELWRRAGRDVPLLHRVPGAHCAGNPGDRAHAGLTACSV